MELKCDIGQLRVRKVGSLIASIVELKCLYDSSASCTCPGFDCIHSGNEMSKNKNMPLTKWDMFLIMLLKPAKKSGLKHSSPGSVSACRLCRQAETSVNNAEVFCVS